MGNFCHRRKSFTPAFDCKERFSIQGDDLQEYNSKDLPLASIARLKQIGRMEVEIVEGRLYENVKSVNPEMNTFLEIWFEGAIKDQKKTKTVFQTDNPQWKEVNSENKLEFHFSNVRKYLSLCLFESFFLQCLQ